MSINQIIFSGNLTRDPKTATTPEGTHILEFSVAINERRKVGAEWVDAPVFLDCTMFGNRTKKLSQMIKKGTKVAINGRVRQHSWKTDNGEKRSKIDIIVYEIEIMQKPTNRFEENYDNYEDDYDDDYEDDFID